jgi:hypothetical protein
MNRAQSPRWQAYKDNSTSEHAARAILKLFFNSNSDNDNAYFFDNSAAMHKDLKPFNVVMFPIKHSPFGAI